MSDPYERLEQKHEERERAAGQLGRAIFGVPSKAEAAEKESSGPGLVGSADAGARTPEKPPKGPSPVEKLRDFILYGPEDPPAA